MRDGAAKFAAKTSFNTAREQCIACLTKYSVEFVCKRCDSSGRILMRNSRDDEVTWQAAESSNRPHTGGRHPQPLAAARS